jgi:hypothetical protein
MEKPHETSYLDKLIFVKWKFMGIPTRFIQIIIFFDEAFKYGDGAILWEYSV